MTHSRIIIVIVALTVFVTTAVIQAGPIDLSRHLHPKKIQMVHEAEHSVDHAWEVYHGAALGGTVASPDLQAKIEQHLHKARILISQAQEAADRGDASKVERLVGNIKIHTAQAIAGSKVQKK